MILSKPLGWLAWLTLAVALVPGSARAQVISFAELPGRIKPGDTVSIVEANGQRTTGKIADLTSSSLTLLLNGARKTFPEAAVRRIVVRDSPGNGALIGLVAGAVPGTLFAIRSCEARECISGSQLVFGALIGFVGAAIGSGIDGLIHETINVSGQGQASLTLAPVIGRGRQGILVSIRF